MIEFEIATKKADEQRFPGIIVKSQKKDRSPPINKNQNQKKISIPP
jgi:hypothetical protein